jgi:shikimate kinase
MTGPLFLVGFMGSGKSALGARVAGELGLDFSDTDALIAGSRGKTVEQIFAEKGEAAFREMESELVDRLCSGKPLVAATGGGTFLSFRSRQRMIAVGITVWLDTPLQAIYTRLADDGSRPLWNRDDTTGMQMLFDTRRPTYALARYRVDGADPDAAVEQLAGIIRRR